MIIDAYLKNVNSVNNSLFAENGVIVRNLNYRPWQWVYSISGCKSFPIVTTLPFSLPNLYFHTTEHVT
jgi:hypothetical protein